MTRLTLPKEPAAAIAWIKERSAKLAAKPAEFAVRPADASLQGLLDELATPRISAFEAIQRAASAGVKIEILGPNSYTVEGPNGRFLFEGTAITDENFTNDPLGQINISLAWRILRAVNPSEIYQMAMSEQLLSQLNGIDVDPDRVSSCTPRRREMPLLFINVPQGLFLIDGAHRLLAKAIHGGSSVSGFILNEQALDDLRVRLWRLR